ncbi:hypothetical protein KSF78_0006308 [Schistosoma japonicum]|nr:hypothetical protein KSF78_0006308 [Schistosoma japonicum]
MTEYLFQMDRQFLQDFKYVIPMSVTENETRVFHPLLPRKLISCSFSLTNLCKFPAEYRIVAFILKIQICQITSIWLNIMFF